jgi:hypothetical protein
MLLDNTDTQLYLSLLAERGLNKVKAHCIYDTCIRYTREKLLDILYADRTIDIHNFLIVYKDSVYVFFS